MYIFFIFWVETNKQITNVKTPVFVSGISHVIMITNPLYQGQVGLLSKNILRVGGF